MAVQILPIGTKVSIGEVSVEVGRRHIGRIVGLPENDAPHYSCYLIDFETGPWRREVLGRWARISPNDSTLEIVQEMPIPLSHKSLLELFSGI